jgi:hypothetical protein
VKFEWSGKGSECLLCLLCSTYSFNTLASGFLFCFVLRCRSNGLSSHSVQRELLDSQFVVNPLIVVNSGVSGSRAEPPVYWSEVDP